MAITLNNIKEIIELISTYPNNIASVDPKFTEPKEFRSPEDGEFYISNNGTVQYNEDDYYDPPMTKRLIVELKPKKYRFVCDDPKLRVPKVGDWILMSQTCGFLEIKPSTWSGFMRDATTIFRREEIEDA